MVIRNVASCHALVRQPLRVVAANLLVQPENVRVSADFGHRCQRGCSACCCGHHNCVFQRLVACEGECHRAYESIACTNSGTRLDLWRGDAVGALARGDKSTRCAHGDRNDINASIGNKINGGLLRSFMIQPPAGQRFQLAEAGFDKGDMARALKRDAETCAGGIQNEASAFLVNDVSDLRENIRRRAERYAAAGNKCIEFSGADGRKARLKLFR